MKEKAATQRSARLRDRRAASHRRRPTSDGTCRPRTQAADFSNLCWGTASFFPSPFLQILLDHANNFRFLPSKLWTYYQVKEAFLTFGRFFRCWIFQYIKNALESISFILHCFSAASILSLLRSWKLQRQLKRVSSILYSSWFAIFLHLSTLYYHKYAHNASTKNLYFK